MKKLTWLVFAVVVLAQGAMAQSSADLQRVKRSDEILVKVRQLDLLNQILPVLITKDQLKKVLPPIEKARAAVRKAEHNEYEFLKKLEPTLDTSLKDAYTKGKVPVIESLKETYATLRALGLIRETIIAENTDAVLAVVEETFNDGQKASAKNALAPSVLDPRHNPKTMDDKAKLRFWVRTILLDPLAYDILLKLNK